jgi:uncharacterized protein
LDDIRIVRAVGGMVKKMAVLPKACLTPSVDPDIRDRHEFSKDAQREALKGMRIYRKIVPKIAKDIIRSLLLHKAIEVEDGRRDEAELDVAGVIVEYLDEVDRLNQDARDAIQRHGFSPETLGRVKRSIANTRGLRVGDDAEEFIIERVLGGLFHSRNIEEIFGEDHDIRKAVKEAMDKYVGVDEELDREVRGRLKNLREGTSEWEVEYGRLIEQMRHVKTA